MSTAPRRPLRVLVATHNYPRHAGDPAGAFVARLAAAAARAGHDVRVVAPHAPGLAVEEVRDGVHVTRYRYAPERLERVGYRGDLHTGAARRSPVVALGVPGFVLGLRRTLRHVARRWQPDVVHAHWWLPAGWAARGLGAPLVVTCHGSDVRLLGQSALLRRVARHVLGQAAAVTTVSRFLAAELERQLPSLATPRHVLRMPVDVARFSAAADTRGDTRGDVPRILYAGNLVASKGVDVLLRAVALLAARGTACELAVVGDGPEREPLRALAASLGIAERIRWSPFVAQDAMPAQYGAATVTVLASRGNAEGLGLVLVEALLAGSAVVATPAGGIPEVVEDERTGLLVRDGDAAHLADQLARILTDGALRTRLVTEGQARVRQTFAADACAAHHLALYHDVARAHDQPRPALRLA